MNLDRRITIEIEPAGSYVEGEYMPGPAGVFEVWAAKDSDMAGEDATVEGRRAGAMRSYKVRWFGELAAADPATVTVADDTGAAWIVEAVSEGEERRRFLDLRCVRRVR